MNEHIEELKEYIEESGVELSDIDLGEKEVCDIKSNPILLAEFYVKYFQEFSKIFRDSKDENIRMILHNKKIFIDLVRLSCYKNNSCEFAKTRSAKILENYVIDNYDDISWFFDFWMELSGGGA